MVIYNIKNSKELASYINYTNLNNMITEKEMTEFLEKAKELNFNSVVISPTYVPLAKEILKDTNIKVGSVIGFPLGFEDSESKIANAKTLIDKGVDELEVVLNLSYLKDEKYELLENVLSNQGLEPKYLKQLYKTLYFPEYVVGFSKERSINRE
jgi:deoxyribose-phosphate aldolase